MPDIILAFLRYGFLLLLYFFLFHAIKLIARDLFFSPAHTSVYKQPMSAFLRVRSTKKNSLKRGDIYFLGENTSVGRDLHNDIVLSEEHVSAKHALILRQGGAWLLRDLGSANGTYVNGVKIQEAVELRPGDIINIGGVTLEMRWKDAG